MKVSVKDGRPPTKGQWERGSRDFFRFGLLMRRMALDWTLSRRQRVDFGVLPQKWERYSKEGRISDLSIVRRRDPQALARKTELLRCMFSEGMDVTFTSEIR